MRSFGTLYFADAAPGIEEDVFADQVLCSRLDYRIGQRADHAAESEHVNLNAETAECLSDLQPDDPGTEDCHRAWQRPS